MSDDRLLAATRALREARGGTSDTADATEARILALAQERRRPKRLHWLIPIAAVLAVSTAWAASQPGLRAAASSAWQRLVEPSSRVSPPARPAAASPASTSAASVVAPFSSPAPAPNAPPPGASTPPLRLLPAPSSRTANAAARPSSAERPSSALAAAPTSEPTAAVAPAAPTALELYRHAHELHFRAHDFVAALPAWDRYLASNASGALALEARYNRAICLAQLGRRDEAKAALLPFARGDYGGYRQVEAQRLIDTP